MTEIWHQLNDIARSVLTAAEASDVEDTLQQIASVGRDLVKCKYAALGIPDGLGGLRYFMTEGMEQRIQDLMPHHPKGHGLIGEIMRQRHTLVLERMQDHPSSVGFPEHHPMMTTFLGVPIILGKQLFGMMYLCDRFDGEPFDEQDRTLIETLAGYAALTIANVEMNAQHQRLKLLEQREHIGMELHDGIIQSLYGLGMQIELMRQQETVPGQSLDAIIDSLNATIEDIRDYIMQLRASEKPRMTIKAHLEHIRKRLLVPESVNLTIEAPDIIPPFTPHAFESIGLIINEALSNAVRHSGATHITIKTDEVDNHFIITVQDNGTGFDVDKPASGGSSGLGLRNMQHRARLYGGTIDVSTQPSAGTTVKISIPLQK